MTKILLVEDDKSLREIYGVRLLAEGYDIVSAGDGEEALAMAIKEKPSLIVSDVMMPKISGFDMLDILRSTTETKNIKVIMMTALSSEEQRLRGEQLGADRYLVKSQVGIEDVVRTVHDVLGDAPATPPAASAFGITGPTAVVAPAPVSAPTVTIPPRPAAPEPIIAPVSAPVVPQVSALPTPTPSSPIPVNPAVTAIPVVAPPVTSQPASAGPTVAQPRQTLSDRIIQPIEHNEVVGPDISQLISQELNGETTPTPMPETKPIPPASSGLSFEETPLPPASSQPPQF